MRVRVRVSARVRVRLIFVYRDDSLTSKRDIMRTEQQLNVLYHIRN